MFGFNFFHDYKDGYQIIGKKIVPGMNKFSGSMWSLKITCNVRMGNLVDAILLQW